MKKLAASLGAVLVLSLAVYGVGMILPQDHQAVVSRDINASPEAVWRAIRDVESYPRWRTDVDGVEPLRSGSADGWMEVSLAERQTLVFLVVEEDPLRRRIVRLVAEDTPFGGTWTTDIEPRSNGTGVTITEDGSVYSPLFRFLARFVFGHERTARRWLEDLDAYLEERGVDRVATSAEYEPDLVYRWGRLNPDAAPEVAQFAFLIGRFESTEERRLPAGSYETRTATWEAKYILNGHAIQDTYRGSGAVATNIRFFDTERKRWLVSYQAKPGNLFGIVWEGGIEGDRMVLTTTYPNAHGDMVFSRLTYYDITPSGFEWMSEEINRRTAEHVVDWRISARRITHD